MKNPHPPGGFVTPVPALILEMAKSMPFSDFVVAARKHGYIVSNVWDSKRGIPVIYPIH